MPEQPPFPPNAIHVVRTAQQIHVQLSAMADQKASILMGATFVIFTITIGQAHGTRCSMIRFGLTACTRRAEKQPG